MYLFITLNTNCLVSAFSYPERVGANKKIPIVARAQNHSAEFLFTGVNCLENSLHIYIYRVSREECARLRENVP